MAYPIQSIEGVGASYGSTLATAGIHTTDDLLRQCADRRGRQKVAARTGLDEGRLLRWANLADLMRVKGVGRQYSELLEAAGVDTVKELRTRRADNLAAAMRDVNAARRLAKLAPTASTVERWVERAADLTPLVTH